jgi:hypothetical protein
MQSPEQHLCLGHSSSEEHAGIVQKCWPHTLPGKQSSSVLHDFLQTPSLQYWNGSVGQQSQSVLHVPPELLQRLHVFSLPQ